MVLKLMMFSLHFIVVFEFPGRGLPVARPVASYIASFWIVRYRIKRRPQKQPPA